MLAAAFNDVGVVRYLLDVVGDVDARDDQGVTLLMLAAGSNESAEPVHLLLDRGADGTLRDALGKTAFDYYRENWYATDRDAFDRLHAAQGR